MAWLFWVALMIPPTPLAADEELLLLPAYIFWNEAEQSWQLQARAWVFEPETNSWRRQLAIFALRRSVGLKESGQTEAAAKLFKRRAALFVVDNESGRSVAIQLGEEAFSLPPTDKYGQSQGYFTLQKPPQPLGVNPLRDLPARPFTVDIAALLEAGETRSYAAPAWVLPPVGVSVVSDIDDTIKITEVNNRTQMLSRTLTQEFEPVDGMASLYQLWAEQGAAFHYVSSSPWQLFTELRHFLECEDFPAGTFHLRPMQLLSGFAWESADHKPPVIRQLMADCPTRKFILVGDSGEQDPENYGQLARAFPEQVIRVLIRNVTRHSADSARMQSAFKDVPAAKWLIFDDANDLPAVAREIAR